MILCSCYFSACTVAMLSWFVDEAIVEATIKSLGKRLVEEEDVEKRPERVPNAILDENVDIYLIRKYFSNDAWLVTKSLKWSIRNKGILFMFARAATMIYISKHLLYVITVCCGITYSALA